MFSATKFQIGKVFGVPVKVDISLLLVAGMLVFSYAPATGSPLGALVAGVLATIALAIALFVHEAGHAAVALYHRCRVHEITLMFFGGYAAISGLPSAPLKRAGISLAGPAAGFLLWAFARRLAVLLPLPPPLAFCLACVAHYSLFLSFFNLIPALPLDGGHALRAILTHFKGRAFATLVATKLSFGIAVAMGLYGLLFRGSVLLVFLAFFVWASAKNELARSAMSDDPDDLDDDIVVISPPPYGKEKEYTRIKRR